MKKLIIAAIIIAIDISLVGICFASLTKKQHSRQAACTTSESSSLQNSKTTNNSTNSNEIKNTHIIELTDKFYVTYINDIL